MHDQTDYPPTQKAPVDPGLFAEEKGEKQKTKTNMGR
jgi:hypothetical protein